MGKSEASSRKYLGFVFFAAAPFFLFNPDYAIVDFLPDLIGYVLIILSLRKMRDISSKLSEAYEGFSRLAAVSGFKLFAAVLLFASSSSVSR